MGSTVQYVAIRAGIVVKATAGDGLTFDVRLAAGLAETLRRIDTLTARDLGDAPCDGAALLDVDTRRLLLFTHQPWSEDPRTDAENRAGLLDGLSRTWPGWQIGYAHNGLEDLAAYLRSPGDLVPTPPLPGLDITRGRGVLAERFEDLWPGERASDIYRDTVNAASEQSQELPAADRRAFRKRSREAAESAMIEAVEQFRSSATDLARILRNSSPGPTVERP
ncbi:hypothetical protein [Winogradskya humida]|uniref:Uncharacterized protein n=1 Tax=Winogradskya humida TaxID=113566 RepID=A0ABQ3ZXW8_9ACTN|nr:hypothetical protein [Actinoplanes humidus]GIE23399.1 hypothetical protein Ahu01nite_065010 [Actinoplanes humidus]